MAEDDHAQTPWKRGEEAWVFGYASLMRNPGFEVAEARVARLPGYSRSFCMRSIHHRGTVERPGLVLALDADAGASCAGLALRVAPGHEDATLAYLRERELISSAYIGRLLDLRLSDGRHVRAVAYVVDRDHDQYCGGLDLEEQAQIIAVSTGGRGPNHEYLSNTVAHLAELGIEDAELAALSARVATLRN